MPTRTAEALDTPRMMLVAIWNITLQMLLAATISLLICPRMTECMEMATLHSSSLSITGKP